MTELSGIHQRTEELLHLWEQTARDVEEAIHFDPIGRRVYKVMMAFRPLLGQALVNLVKAKRHYYGESKEL